MIENLDQFKTYRIRNFKKTNEKDINFLIDKLRKLVDLKDVKIDKDNLKRMFNYSRGAYD